MSDAKTENEVMHITSKSVMQGSGSKHESLREDTHEHIQKHIQLYILYLKGSSAFGLFTLAICIIYTNTLTHVCMYIHFELTRMYSNANSRPM